LHDAKVHPKATDLGECRAPRGRRLRDDEFGRELTRIMKSVANSSATFNHRSGIGRVFALLALLVAGVAVSGCSSIRESRGYVTDQVLLNSVQPGIDNLRSVEGTLGRPTFESQYGQPTWYYVSSITGRRPFVRPRIRTHGVLAVKFDEAGNVTAVERSGIDQVVFLRPEGDKTRVLGRERGFLEDLFGNIGQVGGVGPGGPGGP